MDDSKAEIQNNLTLTHFILEEEKKFPQSTGQLSILLHSIEIASKYISSKVRAAGNFAHTKHSHYMLFFLFFGKFLCNTFQITVFIKLVGLFKLYGVEGSTNATGDVVKKLDIIANEAFITSLKRSHAVRFICSSSCLLKRISIKILISPQVSIMVSEENEQIVVVDKAEGDHSFILRFIFQLTIVPYLTHLMVLPILMQMYLLVPSLESTRNRLKVPYFFLLTP